MLDKYMYSSNTYPFMIFLSTMDVSYKNSLVSRKICSYNRHSVDGSKVTYHRKFNQQICLPKLHTGSQCLCLSDSSVIILFYICRF